MPECEILPLVQLMRLPSRKTNQKVVFFNEGDRGHKLFDRDHRLHEYPEGFRRKVCRRSSPLKVQGLRRLGNEAQVGTSS